VYFSTGGHGSKINKYKKIFSNMGVIVYCITGKKNVHFSYFEKFNITGPKHSSTRYQAKGKNR